MSFDISPPVFVIVYLCDIYYVFKILILLFYYTHNYVLLQNDAAVPGFFQVDPEGFYLYARSERDKVSYCTIISSYMMDY